MPIFGYFSASCSGFRASHFRPNLQWTRLPEATGNQRWLAGVSSRDESPLKSSLSLNLRTSGTNVGCFTNFLDASDDETALKRCTAAAFSCKLPRNRQFKLET